MTAPFNFGQLKFLKALTEAGWLGILIPEEFGGSGLGISAASAVLEEIHHAGCNAAACHAQMYIMGTVLRHGSKEQKERYLPKIASGEVRLQAFGEFSDVGPVASRKTLDLEQEQVLQIGDAVPPRQQLGKAQEAPQLVAEVRECLELAFLEGGLFSG